MVSVLRISDNFRTGLDHDGSIRSYDHRSAFPILILNALKRYDQYSNRTKHNHRVKVHAISLAHATNVLFKGLQITVRTICIKTTKCITF